MARVIRARYENGVLKPLEKLDLEEGEEVIVRVEKKVAYGLVEFIKELREETPKIDNPIEILEVKEQNIFQGLSNEFSNFLAYLNR